MLPLPLFPSLNPPPDLRSLRGGAVVVQSLPVHKAPLWRPWWAYPNTERENRGGGRRERDKRERGEQEVHWHAWLHRHWPPSAASDHPPTPSLRSSPPPHRLSPSVRFTPFPPLLRQSSPLALCRSTGLQLPARLSAWGPRVQERMSVYVCVFVGRWGTWSHACPPYSAFSLFFFSSFFHTALNN